MIEWNVIMIGIRVCWRTIPILHTPALCSHLSHGFFMWPKDFDWLCDLTFPYITYKCVFRSRVRYVNRWLHVYDHHFLMNFIWNYCQNDTTLIYNKADEFDIAWTFHYYSYYIRRIYFWKWVHELQFQRVILESTIIIVKRTFCLL